MPTLYDVEPQLKLTRAEMEERRLQAVGWLESGSSQASVARRFHVSASTTRRWARTLAAEGAAGLRRRKATGRPTRLHPAVMATFFRAIAPALPQGRTRSQGRFMADAIFERFQVRYGADHVGRLIQKLTPELCAVKVRTAGK